MFDPTLHFADLFTLGTMGYAAWRKLAATFASIEEFMKESRADRQAIHQKLDALEARR